MGVHRRFIGEEAAWDWEDATETVYTDPEIKGVTRKTLIGDVEGEPNFHFRYFLIPPGGNSAYHKHSHDHGVMILHGRAKVLIEDQEFIADPRDIVYIPPDNLHQLIAVGDEPLGFLCVIDPKVTAPELR